MGKETVGRRAAPLRVAWRKMAANIACADRAKHGIGNGVKRNIGIGRRTQTDALRLRWPDCVVQAELAISAGAVVTVREINRKPTSCPVLMTWDGEK